MKFRHTCLEAFGYALPAQVVTSAQIERRLAAVYERFGLHEGRIELMSGIRERRVWEDGMLPSQAAARAGQAALEASGARPEEIGALLHTAVSRDCLEPATASFVHEQLSISPEAMIFDISNACLGFVNGMLMLANMIELGQVRKGLIVAGENSRQLLESTIDDLLADPRLTRRRLKDAFASLTIGSGAAALVMAHDSVSVTGHRLLGGAVRSATRHNNLCHGSGDTGFTPDARMIMNTDSETLLVEGCALAVEAWQAFKAELAWTNDDVNRCFTHQVGVAHRDRLYELLELDPKLDFSTLEFLGNVGSVSLPVTMAMGIERDPPTPGSRIALLGIGSGLSSIMLGVEW